MKYPKYVCVHSFMQEKPICVWNYKYKEKQQENEENSLIDFIYTQIVICFKFKIIFVPTLFCGWLQRKVFSKSPSAEGNNSIYIYCYHICELLFTFVKSWHSHPLV